MPGTTRDSVELDLDYHHKDGELLKFQPAIAGLRMKRKVDSPVEYFSTVRTCRLRSVGCCLPVIDAVDGVTKRPSPRWRHPMLAAPSRLWQ